MTGSPIATAGRLTCLMLAVGTVLVGYWGIMPPAIDSPGTIASLPNHGRLAASPSPPEIPDYASIASLVDQRLRGPLYDPPPPPPVVSPPPPPIRVNLKLVGTVLEPGRDQALLANASGKVLFCTVGETITSEPGNLLLESVTENDAVLLVRDPREETVKLTIARDGTD